MTADIDLLLISSSSEDYTEDSAENSDLFNKAVPGRMAGAGGETILLAENNSNNPVSNNPVSSNSNNPVSNNPVSSNPTNSLNGNSSNTNTDWAPGLGTNDFTNPDVINAIKAFVAERREPPTDERSWINKVNSSDFMKGLPPIKEGDFDFKPRHITVHSSGEKAWYNGRRELDPESWFNLLVDNWKDNKK